MANKFELRILFILLSSISLTKSVELDDPCINASLCSKEAGLICGPDNTCICTNGGLTSYLQYSMVWNATAKKCFGQVGSACIGTSENSPRETSRVDCAQNLICVQVKGLPIGVGKCELITRPTSLTHGEICNMKTYCNKAAGLICGESKTCTCTNGTLNEDVKFTMEWNSENSKCLASVGSACVGTVQNPIVDSPSVVCIEDTTCEESATSPVGVGICTSTDTPSTEGLTSSSTEATTPSAPIDGAVTNVHVNTLTIGIFVVFTLFVVQ